MNIINHLFLVFFAKQEYFFDDFFFDFIWVVVGNWMLAQ